MDKSENLYRNLLIILKMFKNRPYHLAKYLVDNSAFDEKFIEKIVNSERLNNINEKDINNIFNEQSSVYFIDVSSMNDYYNSLIDDIQFSEKKKSEEEFIIELNLKLDKLIISERYEDAARLRDYMSKNNIPRTGQKS